MKQRLIKSSLAVLSGLLTFAAFPPLKLAYLAWISFVPFYLMIRLSDEKEAFRYSYVTGLFYFGSLLYWLPNVTVPGAVVLVMVLALFCGVFGYLSKIIFKYSMELLVIPFLWVILEYIRGHIFTGFPWGITGYTQYRNVMFIQVADTLGVYGVSFILQVFNVAFFSYATGTRRKVTRLVAAAALILVTFLYGYHKMDDPAAWNTARISVVQGNIPQKLKWDPAYAGEALEEYAVLTRSASRDKPDLIVWPETAYPYLLGSGERAPELSEVAVESGTPLLVGAVYRNGEEYFNSAVLFSDKGDMDGVYFKMHLVPFGEFIPFERFFGILKGYIDKPIGDYARGDEYVLFPLRAVSVYESVGGDITRTTSFYKFGVLICFEDIFPYLSREFVLKGADILLNITNDAWFGRTAAAEQHLAASVFRAVENGVPVVRAANTGVSCFIDPLGIVLSRVGTASGDTFVRGLDTADIRVRRGITFYSAYGDVFVLFCGLVTALFFLFNASANGPRSA